MSSKSFIKLALVIITIAVIMGNTSIFVTISFATVIKSTPGKSGSSFAQSCDASKCVTKENHGNGKPGSQSNAFVSCFDLLGINMCDTTPPKNN